jgi:hypothetical protein
VAAGEITDNARAFAAKHRIKLVGGPELARLLPGEGSGQEGFLTRSFSGSRDRVPPCGGRNS